MNDGVDISFCVYYQKSTTEKGGQLNTDETKKAEYFVSRVIQADSFSRENHNRIRHLDTFVDERGLIQVKTKVANMVDTEGFRYPV